MEFRNKYKDAVLKKHNVKVRTGRLSGLPFFGAI